MKMVVGLGNPGKQYRQTRHNVGFELLAKLAEQQGLVKPQSKYEADYFETNLGGEKVILCAPTTYMNLSGRATQAMATFYKIPAEAILVVCDDMNIPLGSLRFRAQGSAGGQKGLAHIIQVLGTENIPRLRLGIGRPPQVMDASTFVLGKFTAEEQPSASQMIDHAVRGVISWIKFGITQTMNEFNSGL